MNATVDPLEQVLVQLAHRGIRAGVELKDGQLLAWIEHRPTLRVRRRFTFGEIEDVPQWLEREVRALFPDALPATVN